jgi:nicotinic acid mononucleotide adenylyltransferase
MAKSVPSGTRLDSAGWPLGKCQKAVQLAPAKAHFAVLVLSGSLNPVCPGHLRLLEKAKERLQRAGSTVVGAWLSPADDTYVQEKFHGSAAAPPALSADFRIHLANLAVATDSLVSVSTWQAYRTEATSPVQVLCSLQAELRKEWGWEKECRVFHVCSSQSLRWSRDVKEEAGQGIVVVPYEDDQGLLLESPSHAFFITEQDPEFSSVSSSTLMASLRQGDVPYVQAKMQNLARPLLAPTDEEWECFRDDYNRIEAFTGKSPTEFPTGKFVRRLADRDHRPLAVLLAGGAMNPVHRGHVRMLTQARARLERAGFHVLGGWLVPWAAKVADAEAVKRNAPALSYEFRRQVARLSVVNDDFVEVGATAATLEETPCQSMCRLRAELLQRFAGSLKDCSLSVFYATGADAIGRLELQSCLNACSSGVVIVPRSHDSDPLMENPRQRLFLADADETDETPMAAGLSSSLLREHISLRSWAVASATMEGVAARFVLTPSPNELKEFGDDFKKLGISGVLQDRLKACINKNVVGSVSPDQLVNLLAQLDTSWTDEERTIMLEGVRSKVKDGRGVALDEFVDWVFHHLR